MEPYAQNSYGITSKETGFIEKQKKRSLSFFLLEAKQVYGTFCVSTHGRQRVCVWNLTLIFFVPQVPVQSVLLLLHNVNRKDAHHLTTLLVVSSAAAVSSSLLGCYIFYAEKQNKYISHVIG